MKNEFILAFNEVIEEKQLPKEVILQALESAMVHAYRRSLNASADQKIEARVDPETGKVLIYAEKEVVEEVLDDRTEVNLARAKAVDPNAEIGGLVVVESTPTDFGRVAAQTARQVIQQRIRDAERQAQLDYYSKQLGEIVSGIVQAANSQGLTIGLELRAEGILYRKEMIPGERFRIHDRVRALVAEAKDSNKGPQIILSRTHRDFLRRLLENEVPEIYHGIVEIRSIAREPGERAKVAVSTTQAGIDPVGACVGIRGVRIQAIVRELHDEKIDVIEWNPDPVVFIAKAISPARVTGVYLSEKNAKTATVVVPEDQLSLAIGRDGQNARLAAKLTGWRIDIKSLSEATSDAINKLQSEPSLAANLEAEKPVLEHILDLLGKKAEGRPLTAEAYEAMAHFTDRVKKKIAFQNAPEEQKAELVVPSTLTGLVPEETLLQNLLDSGLPEHVANILQESGYITNGDLLEQMQKNMDVIFRLQGIGPKAMDAINQWREKLLPSPVIEEAVSSVEKEIPVENVAREAEPESVKPLEEAIKIEPLAETVEFETQQKVEKLTSEPEIETVKATEETPEGTGEEEEETEVSFEELFKLKPSIMTDEVIDDEEEEIDEANFGGAKKKKKKKKRRFVEIEYDPEADLTVVHKKHKLGDDEWEIT